ncbi:hypothetical protein [Chitinophaga deserti]|uniref:hypothetical protein n=1 Tax=Chitinophaga deserti TaxID=2164099 RepID=UPI000D6B935A|nr:hypothetical protein [Chitinophaga deserti]
MRIAYISLIMCCATIFAGCSKSNGPGGGDDPNPNPPGEDNPPVMTGKGVPDGSAATQKSIGAAGGTLTSVDGLLTLTVPAGAFTSNQNVSIQRISNLNPSAAGPAFRLLPEGVTFAKPVSITFKCPDTDSTIFAPEYLRGSYQKANGGWWKLPGTINTTARTVTVQTTHFSDWSAVSDLKLVIEQPVLPAEGRSGLTVYYDGNPAPQPGQELAIYLPKLLPETYVRRWKIEKGGGKLVSRTFKENPISFRADRPVPKPPNDLTTISVEVQPDPKDPKTVKLQGNIRTTLGMLLLKINDGNDIEFIADYAVYDNTGYWRINARTESWGNALVIHWPVGVGDFPFSINPLTKNPGVTVTYNGNSYGYTYETEKEVLPSPGGVFCKNTGTGDGYVRGDFTVSKAGNVRDPKRTVKITGSFAVPRIRTEEQ